MEFRADEFRPPIGPNYPREAELTDCVFEDLDDRRTRQRFQHSADDDVSSAGVYHPKLKRGFQRKESAFQMMRPFWLDVAGYFIFMLGF